MPYFLGLDCGTRGLRAVVADLSGQITASAFRAYPTQHPQVAWAEQEPADWWRAACAAVPEALAAAGLRPADLAGLSVCGTSCTVVACTEDSRPLRPALLWMDQRAHREAEAVTATGDPVLRYVGWQESPEWMLAKALWLRGHEPEVYEQAERLVESVDWLIFRLTGRWTASTSNATAKWHYATPEGGWPDRLLAALGLSELRDKWPREALPMGAPVGPLAAAAADELGLRPGLPVAEGGIDAYAAMYGLGVVKPGRLALVLGSSTCHQALSDRPLFESHTWGPYPDAPAPGLWLLEGGQAATGTLVAWLADSFGGGALAEAKERGLDHFAVLDEKAAAVPPGAEGLVLLDYWQGNRTPVRDPLARGAIWGLSLRHGAGHLLRAVYEGITLGSRHIQEDLRQAGFVPEATYACGGGTRSELWLQTQADVTGSPLYLTREPEATALGTATLAAAGAGFYASPVEAAEQMVRVTREVHPRPELKALYDDLYEDYLATYEALRPLMHRRRPE